MSTGLLCHKIGRLQLCKLLTLTQAIPTNVFFSLFSHLVLSPSDINLILCMDVVGLCLKRTAAHHIDPIGLLSPSAVYVSESLYSLCLCTPNLQSLYVADRVSLTDRLLLSSIPFHRNCFLDTVMLAHLSVCWSDAKLLLSLRVHCSNLCYKYINRDANDSLFYGQSPPCHSRTLFGLGCWLTFRIWQLEDEQRSWLKRETLLFECITFLDLF